MRIVEIFHSIDGEGARAGEPATFIRVAGCNLHCDYCDTAYAQDARQGERRSVADLIAMHGDFLRNVTVTGGEPLLQPTDLAALVRGLAALGHDVNIETNGSRDITPLLGLRCLVTMDYKTASSGEEGRNLLANLARLRAHDVLKFVLGPNDLGCVERVLTEHPTRAAVYLSPVFGRTDPAALAELAKELTRRGVGGRIRVQLQLHKLIWGEARGV